MKTEQNTEQAEHRQPSGLYAVRWQITGPDAFKAALYLHQLGWFHGHNVILIPDHDNHGYAVVQSIMGESARGLCEHLRSETASGIVAIASDRDWACNIHVWVIEASAYLAKLADLLDDPRGLVALQLMYVPNLGLTMEDFDERFRQMAQQEGKVDEAATNIIPSVDSPVTVVDDDRDGGDEGEDDNFITE